MSQVTKDAARLNLPEEKLLGDWIVRIPGFTLEKYRELQRSRLSIFSVNCFGGIVSNTLGLPFRSPFVNLFLPPGHFIKFLKDPAAYMKVKMTYHEDHFVESGNYSYPVAKLGDILLYMMHYKTFEESVEAWERRKTQINWDNLFVEMFLFKEDKELLKEFDALPYAKKVCFVPFQSDFDWAWYVDPAIDKKSGRIDTAVNHLAFGNVYRYDLFDMLLYGKKTPLD